MIQQIIFEYEQKKSTCTRPVVTGLVDIAACIFLNLLPFLWKFLLGEHCLW